MNAIQQAIDIAHVAGVRPRGYDYPRNGKYIEIRVNNKSKKEQLIQANGSPTANGRWYYNHYFNNAIPKKFNIERGILNNTIRMGHKDIRITGTRGQILKRPQEFFKYAKQQYIVKIPYMKYWEGSDVRRPIRDQVNSWYKPLYLPFVDTDLGTQNKDGKFF